MILMCRQGEAHCKQQKSLKTVILPVELSKPGVVAHASNSSTQRLRQKECLEFEAILGYIEKL